MAERARPSRALAPGEHPWLAAWLPVLLPGGLVLFLSSRPHLPLPTTIPHLDKAAHFTEYALLGWLLRRALSMTLPGGRGATGVAIALVALLGRGRRVVPGHGHRAGTRARWIGWPTCSAGATGAVVVAPLGSAAGRIRPRRRGSGRGEAVNLDHLAGFRRTHRCGELRAHRTPAAGAALRLGAPPARPRRRDVPGPARPGRPGAGRLPPRRRRRPIRPSGRGAWGASS